MKGEKIMENEQNATIEFIDGSSINTKVNGSCFITDEQPTIPKDLSIVTIIYNDRREESGIPAKDILYHCKYIKCASVDGRFWFSFEQMSSMERWQAEIEDALCELSEGV